MARPLAYILVALSLTTPRETAPAARAPTSARRGSPPPPPVSTLPAHSAETTSCPPGCRSAPPAGERCSRGRRSRRCPAGRSAPPASSCRRTRSRSASPRSAPRDGGSIRDRPGSSARRSSAAIPQAPPTHTRSPRARESPARAAPASRRSHTARRAEAASPLAPRARTPAPACAPRACPDSCDASRRAARAPRAPAPPSARSASSRPAPPCAPSPPPPATPRRAARAAARPPTPASPPATPPDRRGPRCTAPPASPSRADSGTADRAPGSRSAAPRAAPAPRPPAASDARTGSHRAAPSAPCENRSCTRLPRAAPDSAAPPTCRRRGAPAGAPYRGSRPWAFSPSMRAQNTHVARPVHALRCRLFLPFLASLHLTGLNITVRPVSDDQRLADELASLHIRREPEGSRAKSGGVPRWLVTVLVLGLLGTGGYLLFNKTEQRLFPEEVELGAVTLVSPAQEDVTLVATGYVFSRKKATVAPKVQGRLSRLFVDEGDPVKENQLVATLDASEPEAQLAQVKADIFAARAKVERARADLAEAQTKLSREQKLLASAAGTQAAVEDASARVTTAKAQLAAAEADVSAVQARSAAAAIAVENMKVRAPFAGTVIRKLSEIGEVVSPGGVGLLTIATLTDLEVQADVNEAQLSKVKIGTPAEILLDAFPDRRFRAEVREIRQTVDRAKAAVTVKVRFKDDPKGVLPDMAAKVSFLSKALDDAALKVAPKLVAPADAVVERAGRKVVLVVDDGRLKELPVVPGGAIGSSSMLELISGPTTGTRIVRHPADKLHEGSSVKEKGK
ncbi:MAG: efflux RND transporter periplasmic adaptor subunit [Myxococcales bacterium]|nr:efflux RND transporter periplasmic adaptor subunit [Myxococcales bacterium]